MEEQTIINNLKTENYTQKRENESLKREISTLKSVGTSQFRNIDQLNRENNR